MTSEASEPSLQKASEILQWRSNNLPHPMALGALGAFGQRVQAAEPVRTSSSQGHPKVGEVNSLQVLYEGLVHVCCFGMFAEFECYGFVVVFFVLRMVVNVLCWLLLYIYIYMSHMLKRTFLATPERDEDHQIVNSKETLHSGHESTSLNSTQIYDVLEADVLSLKMFKVIFRWRLLHPTRLARWRAVTREAIFLGPWGTPWGLLRVANLDTGVSSSYCVCCLFFSFLVCF